MSQVRRIAPGLCLVLLLSGNLTHLRAAAAPLSQTNGISISPPLREVVLGPGLKQARTTLNLTNTSGRDVSVTIRLVDFQALDEFGGVSLGEVNQPLTDYSLAHWMKIDSPKKLTIRNGQAVEVPLLIDNTSDLAPGGHYGAAIATISRSNDNASGIQLKQELASLVFVKKTGGESYGLELSSIEAKELPAMPQEVTLRFKSTGNVHVVPRGYVEVTDPTGVVVSKGIINPESTMVLPDNTRQFITLMQPVSSSNRKGQYKITAYYRYDGQDNFQTRTLYFNHGASRTLLYGGLLTGVIVLAIMMIARKIRRESTH